MKKINKNMGVVLMISSALCTSLGQLFWKMSNAQINILLILGFAFYSAGAIILVLALSFGDLSKLHPLLCFSYIFALLLGYFILGENISLLKLLGIGSIITGVIFILRGGND